MNLLQPKLVGGVRGQPGQRALSRVKVEFALGQGRAVVSHVKEKGRRRASVMKSAALVCLK